MDITDKIEIFIGENDNTDMAVMDKRMSGQIPSKNRRKSKKVKDEDSEEAAPKG